MVPRVYIFYTCVTYSNSLFFKPCFSVRDIVVNLKELKSMDFVFYFQFLWVKKILLFLNEKYFVLK